MAFGHDDVNGVGEAGAFGEAFGEALDDAFGEDAEAMAEGEAGDIRGGAPPRLHDTAERDDDHHPSDAPRTETTPGVSRRRVLQVLGMLPLAGAAGAVSSLGAQQGKSAHTTPAAPVNPPKPANNQPKRVFFNAAEWRIVRVLADDVIPKDSHSGSATDAGVPEFMDFHLGAPETDENTRTAFRGGLRWMDTESRKRFGVGYAAASRAQRHQILDDVAYPDKVKPEHRHGSTFFMRFRDMCASGFFSSAVGFQDLRYQGNTFVPVWNGCPPEALKKLGVSYDIMTSRVGRPAE